MKLNPSRITGIDISLKMLEIGKEKIERKGFSGKIKLMPGDSENIPFSDSVFDVAMVAFGVRNFSDPLKGLSEMRRVIRNGGMIVVLEFSKPSAFPFRPVYNFYFRNILPFFGKLFSKDKAAYRYLHDSVMKFPDNEEFLSLLAAAGYSNTRQIKLTGGVASIYTGVKLSTQ
jgi:demethylmenaquinone methyltransferase/2-methoxy-6-polyprenyl-1,4-benzoquinol methylase